MLEWDVTPKQGKASAKDDNQKICLWFGYLVYIIGYCQDFTIGDVNEPVVTNGTSITNLKAKDKKNC